MNSGNKISLEETLAAAEHGSADEKFMLGRRFEIGDGVPRDEAQADIWYRKAVEQYVKAERDAGQAPLGEMYETGRGALRDDAQAAIWFQKAADQGHAEAQFMLKWPFPGWVQRLLPHRVMKWILFASRLYRRGYTF